MNTTPLPKRHGDSEMPDPISKGPFLGTLARVVLEALKGLDNQIFRVAVAAAAILAIIAVMALLR